MEVEEEDKHQIIDDTHDHDDHNLNVDQKIALVDLELKERSNDLNLERRTLGFKEEDVKMDKTEEENTF